jgi:hypothetical protein
VRTFWISALTRAMPDPPPPWTTVGEPLPQHLSASSRPSPTANRPSTGGVARGSAAVDTCDALRHLDHRYRREKEARITPLAFAPI